jgi:hypothetical protein
MSLSYNGDGYLLFVNNVESSALVKFNGVNYMTNTGRIHGGPPFSHRTFVD